MQESKVESLTCYYNTEQDRTNFFESSLLIATSKAPPSFEIFNSTTKNISQLFVAFRVIFFQEERNDKYRKIITFKNSKLKKYPTIIYQRK